MGFLKRYLVRDEAGSSYDLTERTSEPVMFVASGICFESA